jgi:hypothetical protein
MFELETSEVTARHVVEVEFFGAVGSVLLRGLGSLAERYGMRMEVISSRSSATPTARARITVARASSQREAEETVASLVEWVRRASNHRLSQPAPRLRQTCLSLVGSANDPSCLERASRRPDGASADP